MKKDLINRYVWLVDTILAAGSEGITHKEISDKWERNHFLSNGEEYKWRTFMNHKNDILDIFGIEILCRKSTNSYYIADRANLKDASGFMRWMIQTMSVSNQINESSQLKNRILLENTSSGIEYLSTILEAMRDNKMLTFSYRAFWMKDDAISNLYHVEPYALKFFRQRWYLLGKYGDRPLKVYALDRILDIDIEFESFEMPEDFNAEDFFSSCFGVIVSGNEEPCTVRMKVESYQANYFRSLPLHHSQKEEIREDKYSVFAYFIRPTFDFIQEILSMGETVEIVEPQNLRNEIARIGRELVKKNK